MANEEYWYRFDARTVSVIIDADREEYGTGIETYVKKYKVMKTTPKGVWLNLIFEKRFVLRDARKRWACPTIEEAFESFAARKHRQFTIYTNRAKTAKQMLEYGYRKYVNVARDNGIEPEPLSHYIKPLDDYKDRTL